MGDGHLNKCKKCCKIQANERYREKVNDDSWIESERLRGRIKAKKYKYKANKSSKRKAARKYLLSNKDKRNASNHVHRNLSGRFGLEAHHWSYNKRDWLDIFWLSPSFHGFIHRFMEYDEEAKMYRHYDTKELLDSRQKHKQFMDSFMDEYVHEMKILVDTVYVNQIKIERERTYS